MAKLQEKIEQTLDRNKADLEATETSADGLAVQLFSLIGSRRHQVDKLFSLVLVSFVTAGLQFVTMVKIANMWGKAASL